MAEEGFVVDGSITVDGVNIDLTGTTLGSTLIRTSGSFTATQETPVGTVIMYAGSIGAGPEYSGIPSGWILCDGTAYQTTSYTDLNSVIGTRYGPTPATPGYFAVPNLVDRVPYAHIQSANPSIYTIQSSTSGDANHQHTSTYNASTSPVGYDPSSHNHTINEADTHNHGATSGDGNKGSHTHGPTDYNAGSHSHNYQAGTTSRNTSANAAENHSHDLSATTANHGHNWALVPQSANHEHSASGNVSLTAHSHQVTIGSFAANQSSNQHGHTPSVSTIGFHFIIKA